MAQVPYEALGISPEVAAYVDSPELGPLGLSTIVADRILHRPDNMAVIGALRDLAFDTDEQQGRRVDELNEHERAYLARFCGALAGRLGLKLILEEPTGEQNG